MVDIDNFKQINDNYGHVAGDKVLRETTKRLKIAMRPYDEIGRYGGDEFLLVLPGCDESNLMGISERLCTSIREKKIETDKMAIQTTISLGALSYAQANKIKINSLIQAADAALYQAKKDGRNRIELGSLKKEMGSVTSYQQP
jgi:diguanylate cyclase (GGDEF)-like protein